MKRFVLLLTLAAATMAADCPGGDDTTGPDGGGNASLVGTWTLQSVNNDPLPSNWNDNGTTRVITSGSIVVQANLAFAFTEAIQGIGNDNTSGTCSLTTAPATYTCVPTPVAGEDQNNGIAVVNGNSMTLTITDQGQTDTRIYSRN
jgi:hypothetical protein